MRHGKGARVFALFAALQLDIPTRGPRAERDCLERHHRGPRVAHPINQQVEET